MYHNHNDCISVINRGNGKKTSNRSKLACMHKVLTCTPEAQFWYVSLYGQAVSRYKAVEDSKKEML